MNNTTQTTVSLKINTIRANARRVSVETLVSQHTCPTCCRPAAVPYRRVVDGELTEGCVDAHHQAHADSWHSRTQAHALRRAELASLKR